MHHPQVGPRKQLDSWTVFFISLLVAHLGVTELARDLPKRVLHLGRDIRFELLQLLDQHIGRLVLAERATFARLYGDVLEQQALVAEQLVDRRQGPDRPVCGAQRGEESAGWCARQAGGCSCLRSNKRRWD